MKSENKTVENRARPLGNYPHIKRVGDFLFVSGTSSRRADNSIEGSTKNDDGTFTLDIAVQTKAVIENIKVLLESMDATLDHVVDISSFLVDMKDFKEYNSVYGTYFNAETGPTRTTVAVHQLPHPELVIEIKAMAYLPL